MPSNKFAPLIVCSILVLFFGNVLAGVDNRKPLSQNRFTGQNEKIDLGSVGGRVMTTRGRAISHAQVALYNADLDQWIYTRTGTFGQYSFQELPLSDFYVLVVLHKRYLFLDGSRTFTLKGDMFNVNFIASSLE